MTRLNEVSYRFVSTVPEELEFGTVYISTDHSTSLHLCCCGCGGEVVTPLSPVDWQVTFDGESISLQPSIGNWNFHCKSHYWIRRNRVEWVKKWTRQQIDAGRRREQVERSQHYGETVTTPAEGEGRLRRALRRFLNHRPK